MTINWQNFLIQLHPNGTATINTGDAPSASLPIPFTYSHGYPEQPGQATAAELAWPEFWLGSQLRWQHNQLEILTDHAGCYPFYQADAADGRIILSTEAWAAARAADLKKINTAAALELMAFEYVLGTGTLVDGLSELRQGTLFTYTFTAGAWQRTDQTRWTYDYTGDAPASGSLRRAAAENLLAQAEASAKIIGPDRLALNLSGGWDSRALLGAMHAVGAPPAFTCTYGNARFSGVKRARAVSDSLGVENRFCEMANGDFLMDLFSALCGELPPVVRFNLGDGGHMVASRFYGEAGAAMCGHSGDFFTGIPPGGAAAISSRSEMLTWLKRTVWGSWRETELLRVLRKDKESLAKLPGERLAASVIEGGYTNDIAGAMWWKLENRIRRITAVELRVLQRYTPLILTPMFHREWTEFWRRVPLDSLDKQRLYREALAQHIFTGPRATLRDVPREGGGMLQPGLLNTATSAVRKNSFRLLRRTAPALAAKLSVADPTAAWWATNPILRNWAWEVLEQSEFVNSQFDLGKLQAALMAPHPAHPSLARTGVWNLLTITGAERQLAAKQPQDNNARP